MHGTVPGQGAVVWIRQQRWRVERVQRERDVLRLDVSGRGGRLTFLAPFDRPCRVAASEIPRRVRRQACLARLAALAAQSATYRSVTSAVDARIEILPYQLEPALAMLHGAPRIVIADAVGLGKTIQAGLMISELQRRRPGLRVLVIIPSALRRQWREELRDHFQIDSRIADADALADLAKASARNDGIWERAGVWLASIDYLKQPHVIGAACRSPWDLMVIDEAHGVCGESQRYLAAAELARRARRLVLLSATPHSGDPAAFDRLLGLGAIPALPALSPAEGSDVEGGGDPPVIFRRTRDTVGMPSTRKVRRHSVRLTDEELRLLDVLTEFERAVLRNAAPRPDDPALLLLSVFRKRALSTVDAFNISIDRRLSWLSPVESAGPLWHQSRLDFDAGEDSVTPDESRSLTADIGLDATLERAWLRRLRELGRLAARRESKIRYVRMLVARTPEPVAIFTEFRDSLCRLLPDLSAVRTVSVLHGGLTPQAQEQELERFLSGRSSVLLATDVAGQGLNLQNRCRWVLNLELPWNPVRLEQRAGRVDRLGQRRSVHVGLLVAGHESESGIVAALTRRTRSAQQHLGADALTIARALSASPSRIEPAGVAICDRWARAARQLAADLRRRRALGRRWRTESSDTRPGVGPLEKLPFLRTATGGRTLACFVVPLVDRLGSVVERRLCAVCVPPDTGMSAVRGFVTRHFRARARRLSVLRHAEATACMSRERAIHDAFRTTREPGEVQPGLFEGRALRAREQRSDHLSTLDAALSEELRRLEGQGDVEVGWPSLALIITPEGLR